MIQIPLTGGRFAVVDDEDGHLADLVWSLWKGPGGHEYARHYTSVADGQARGEISLHRAVLGLTDPSILVDHRDGDGLNCRRENLRTATRQVNGRNRGRANRNSSTGHLGVSRCGNDRFRATIRVDGRVKGLGRFDTIEAAVQARLAGEVQYWGIEPRRKEAHQQ